MKEFRQKFIDEASELLEAFEIDLLALEKKPNEKFLTEGILRTMHTLKGSGSMFGEDRIVKITHKTESLYIKIQKNKLQVNDKIISLTFSVSDLILKLLNDENKDKRINDEYLRITDELNEFFSDEELTDKTEIHKKTKGFNLYYISFIPDADIEERGVNLTKIFTQLNKTGQTLIISKNNKNQDTYPICWEIYVATDKDIEIIEEILTFVDLECEITEISEINLLLNKNFTDFIKKHKDNSELISPDEILKHAKEVETQIEEKENAKETNTNSYSQVSNSDKATIRVQASKLDDLMKRVSELITLKSEIKLTTKLKGYNEITELAEKLEKVTDQLRNDVFEVRLVALDSIRVNVERLIRDTAIKLEKEVQFTSEGLHTELDKTIIDKLPAPLMHIIRNSIDHGIENAQVRSKRNKPAHGNIKLKAFRSGSHVHIQITDDGNGIDKEKILQKAIEKRIIKPDDKLSDKEIYNLILESGFTTTETLSSVSGRGVGMDVVKSEINKLRGDIEITSKFGIGTTITLKLPLSVSIVDTLLLQTGKMFFSVPMEDIDRCEIIEEENINKEGSKFLIFKEELLPFLSLRKLFKIKEKLKEPEKSVIIKKEGKSIAIIVDYIIGEYQAVVKPLGKTQEDKDFLSGGSLMPDGNIAYILDSDKLVEFYK